jgi:hypothetical protein
MDRCHKYTGTGFLENINNEDEIYTSIKEIKKKMDRECQVTYIKENSERVVTYNRSASGGITIICAENVSR